MPKRSRANHDESVQAMTSRSSTGRLVYSTEGGRMCPSCRKPVAQCVCRTGVTAAPPSDGIVRISCEKKGRGGKSVTIVRGVPLQAAALEQLAKALKAGCGSGGTVKDGVVEVQGDHRPKVTAMLVAQGFKVKQVGG
jgi:translation initiation factor 1